MRIVFLAPDIDLSGFAGDVSHVIDLASALARAGCEVQLVVAEPDRWRPPDGVRLYRRPSIHTFSSALALRGIFSSSPPDVVYERRENPKLAATLGFLLRRPYFVEINGLVDQDRPMLMGSKPRADRSLSLRRISRSLLLRRAHGVVAVTDGLRDALIRRYALPPRLVTVVANGVDIRRFHPKSKAEARNSLGLSPSTGYLVFVGNLVAWHDLNTMLDAMTDVVRANPNVRLVIVGDGPEKPRLVRRTEVLNLTNHVYFAGRQPREMVPIWIGAADLCVMPLTFERNAERGSSALKLSEYLACGRPVVASDVPGAGPFLESHRVGVGVASGDSAALARALVELLGNPSLLAEMGSRARELAEAELSWDRVSMQLLQLFRDGLGRNGV